MIHSLWEYLKKQYLIIILLVLGVVIGLTLPGLLDQVRRHYCGIAPGVRLGDQIVEGLLPQEVAKLLDELAKKLEQPPQNAYYDQENNRVVPEVIGKKLAQAETLKALLEAKEGARITPIMEPVYPKITHSYFQPVFRGDLSRKAMALMINVAWGNEYIPGILKVLAENEVKATFFFIGSWVERFPDLFNQIVQAGHEIANHGYWHGEPKKMSEAQLKELILKGQEAMEKAGKSPAKLFAPPAGEYDNRLLRIAAGLGYRTILWSIDTIDWQRPDPEVIINRVVPKAQNGGLVLMHPTQPTLTALPQIIQGLRDKGFSLTTVSQLVPTD